MNLQEDLSGYRQKRDQFIRSAYDRPGVSRRRRRGILPARILSRVAGAVRWGFDPELSLLPSVDEFAPPRGTFLLVRLNGQPVGCGGLKPISKEAAYLKRMWIAPGARGLGLARRLLSALEDEARAMGYSIVRLEMNKALVEAQQLCRSAGYTEVAPFNNERYAHHWFEKWLEAGTDRGG